MVQYNVTVLLLLPVAIFCYLMTREAMSGIWECIHLHNKSTTANTERLWSQAATPEM